MGKIAMPTYICWTKAEITNLQDHAGLTKILTEIDTNGRILREMGFNGKGELIYKTPSTSTPYGLFDLQTIEPSTLQNQNHVSSETFEAWWAIEPPENAV